MVLVPQFSPGKLTRMVRSVLKYGFGASAFFMGVALLYKGSYMCHPATTEPAIHSNNSNKKHHVASVQDVTNQSMYSCNHGSDCWKLQELLARKWDQNKPKAAVYILSRTTDVNDLKTTLKHLETNFLSKYNYPVIIFYETDFIPQIPGIRNFTKVNIFFQEVQFVKPLFLHPPAKGFECAEQDLGYNHMCRFHSKILYDLPIMQNLEYYLRLDAHSYITQPVKYDFIKYMKDNNIVYMYPCMRTDLLRCARYLWDAAGLFIKVKHLEPHFFDKMSGLKMFYNNFEAASMDIFKSVPYQNYINYIDQLGGVFYHRWGDAPVKSIAISIFVPENQTRHMYDITYSHRTEQLTRGLSSKPSSNNC